MQGDPCKAELYTLSPGPADGAQPNSWTMGIRPLRALALSLGATGHTLGGTPQLPQYMPYAGRAGAHLGKGNEEELVMCVFQVVQGVLWAMLPHPLLVGLRTESGPQHGLGTTPPRPALNRPYANLPATSKPDHAHSLLQW